MAQRATSLGPKPSLFIIFLFFLVCLSSFPFFALYYKKNLAFPLEKGIFGLFLSVSLCSSLVFFGLPLSQFFFLCLSLLLLLFSFLPVFLFCFLLLPCFCLFLSFSFFSAFVSWKEQHQKDWCTKFFFINIFSFWVSCLLFSLNPFFFSLFFCWFKAMFLFNIFVFGFKKTKLKNTNFWSKGGCNKTVFFYDPVFCKVWKVIVFFGVMFLTNVGWCSKKHYKNRCFSTFYKAKKWKKWPFSKSITGPS